MPTYVYHCQNCGVKFEKYQKFTDKPLTRCPECRKGTVRRVVEPAAIVFKGSGWYKTDSRSNTATGRSAKPVEKSDSAAAKTETKSDSKPDKPAAAQPADD
jgi:putative FmdB family regulatory protein